MKRLALVITALTLVNCAYSKMEYGTDGAFQNEKAEEHLHAQVIWLKNKKDAADVLLNIRNAYKHPVVIKVNDFTLELDGEKASLVPQASMVELVSGQGIEQLLKFRFSTERKREGTAKITLSRVLEGPIESMGKKTLAPLVIEVPVRK
jgi:hypothetical protein